MTAAMLTIVPTTRRCLPDTAAAPGGVRGEWGRPRRSDISLFGDDGSQDWELRRPPCGPQAGEHAGDPAHDEQDGELGDRRRERGRDEVAGSLRRRFDEGPAEEHAHAEPAERAEHRDDHRLPPDHRPQLSSGLTDRAEEPELPG